MSSKIPETTDRIKKKMSFSDVKSRSNKEFVVFENEVTDTQEPVEQHNSITVQQINSENAYHHTSEPVSEVKRKATFYLSEKAFKQIEDLYIKSLIAGKKKDKSSLVCEALDLFHQTKSSN
jgi:viroplasmin and RNaseH domain-containing protein